MQFLNKHVHGHVEVGHIDLLTTMSYFEVPEEDAQRVIKYVSGQQYKGRDVRCNDAAEGGKSKGSRPAGNSRLARATKGPKPSRDANKKPHDKKTYQKDEWMQFLNPKSMKSKELKGEIPDFEEEGWAVRKPRKK